MANSGRTRLRRATTTVVAVVTTGALAFWAQTFIEDARDNADQHDPLFWILNIGTLLLAIPGFTAALVISQKQARGEASERTDSERRVRDAESELEAALRRHVYHQGGDEDNTSGPGSPPDGTQQSAEPPRNSLALPELWGVTHARLGQYHVTAVSQARQAFRNAQWAMGAGFVLLLIFVITAVAARSTAGSIAAGGLGAVAAGLSGYIAKTFVRSQEMTTQALQRYFDEPLALSRYLAAERIALGAGLSDLQRSDLFHALVYSMVTGAPPSRVPGQRDPQSAPEEPQASSR